MYIYVYIYGSTPLAPHPITFSFFPPKFAFSRRACSIPIQFPSVRIRGGKKRRREFPIRAKFRDPPKKMKNQEYMKNQKYTETMFFTRGLPVRPK